MFKHRHDWTYIWIDDTEELKIKRARICTKCSRIEYFIDDSWIQVIGFLTDDPRQISVLKHIREIFEHKNEFKY